MKLEDKSDAQLKLEIAEREKERATFQKQVTRLNGEIWRRYDILNKRRVEAERYRKEERTEPELDEVTTEDKIPEGQRVVIVDNDEAI